MLSKYTDARFTEIFTKYGVFFAFSGKQFAEQKVEGVKYTGLGHGTICPTENVEDYLEALDKAVTDAMKEMKENHTDTEIIRYELSNHECFYAGHWENALPVLEDYGYTEDQVRLVFRGKNIEQ